MPAGVHLQPAKILTETKMEEKQRKVLVGAGRLSLGDVAGIAQSQAPVVSIDPAVKERLARTWSYVEKKVMDAVGGKSAAGVDPASSANPAKRRAIYGVTTGFGAQKQHSLESIDAAKRLQKNIILSHSGGTGAVFSDEVVRAVMLIRAHILASGHNGVRVELVERLVELLNCDVLPLIPEQGSVGCSGDLAPLAHLALGLIGEGKVRRRGKEYENLASLKRQLPVEAMLAKLEPQFDVSYKEGLALINGITVTLAVAALNLQRANHLLLWADAIGSMTAEAILGAPRAFDEIVFKLIYGHKGAAVSAANVRRMTQASTLMNHSLDVHDAYSVRCIPQVHGAVRDVLAFVRSSVENHLQTNDDDPVFFTPEEIREHPPVDGWTERLHFEDGHFHGAPVGYAMDFMGIAMADLGSIAERRIAMLVDANHNRGRNEECLNFKGDPQGITVPGFLTYDRERTTSGMMLAQCTAASLASENKILAHPASVDSIPTSANHEDHVSMSTIAARKARTIITNVEGVLAIELLCASLALAFRTGDLKAQTKIGQDRPRLGAGTQEVYERVKKTLHDFQWLDGRDSILYKEIDAVKELLKGDVPAGVGN
jgi:histidine ammonia-lyase